jgi:lactoylglutathione lyase
MRFLSLLTLCSLLVGAAAPKRPRILGVAQIALNVSDIEKSRGFYKDFLGFAEPFEIRNPDGSLALSFIKINDYQYIELFPGLKAGQDRLNHIALYTDDVKLMRAWLGSQEIKVPPTVGRGRNGDLNFSVTDPEGHKIEFIQYEAGGWSMRGKGKYMSEFRVSTHMLHVGILVGDVEAAMKFYAGVLGFRETWRGAPPGKNLAWINMTVPDGEDYIEFILYKDLPPADRRGSAHHLCLETPDVRKATAELESRPFRRFYPYPLEPRLGVNRRWQLNLYDPDGTRTELMEPQTVDGLPVPSSSAPLPRQTK